MLVANFLQSLKSKYGSLAMVNILYTLTNHIAISTKYNIYEGFALLM